MSDQNKYLTEFTERLNVFITWLKSLKEEERTYENVNEELEKLKAFEAKAREEYGVGTRFNVLRTQLQTLSDEFEHMWAEAKAEQGEALEESAKTLADDETLVYVYLFNAHGLDLKSWLNLLTNQALFEHVANRPIYANESEVERVIRTKPNPGRHAYISVAVKKVDMSEMGHLPGMKDQYGQQMLRLKQGSLKPNKIMGFYHNGQVYTVSSEGFVPV